MNFYYDRSFITIFFQRRDSESGRGGRGGGNRGGGGGPGGFDRMGGGPGGPRDFNDRNAGGRGGWDNGRMGGPGDKAESTFTVPAAKCGVIIGRGKSQHLVFCRSYFIILITF